MPGSFFDTNVLIYIASADLRKADRAMELVAQGGAISVQVMNETALLPAIDVSAEAVGTTARPGIGSRSLCGPYIPPPQSQSNPDAAW